MIKEIKEDVKNRMAKALLALDEAFKRVRTGRAHPSLLDSVMVSYYGSDTPLKQLANITVEDGRTLVVTPWEKHLIPDLERAIMKSNLGLNPSTSGQVIRLPMPSLTEETRRDLIKTVRAEAEHSRVAVRNIRRDANNDFKELLKDKEITEDDESRALDDVQKLTDKFIQDIDAKLKVKEEELLKI